MARVRVRKEKIHTISVRDRLAEMYSLPLEAIFPRKSYLGVGGGCQDPLERKAGAEKLPAAENGHGCWLLLLWALVSHLGVEWRKGRNEWR
jgi:hypothetical protein